MRRVDFENGGIIPNIVQSAFPMLIAQVLNLLYNIVDRIYIARIPEIGTAALGAVGLCFPVIVIITAFSNLFGSGGAPLFLPMKPGAFRRTPACVVVEAELDAMLVHRAAGECCSVLAVGTAHLRHLPAGLMEELKRLPVILVAMDVDANGAGGRGWELWRETFPQAVRWPCIHGKDPGEMFQAAVPGHGHGDVRDWVLAGLPPLYAAAAVRGKREEPRPEQPVPEEPPARPEPSFPTHPVWDLNGYYLGAELVRECLRANGLTLVPAGGDVKVCGAGQLPDREYVKLLPFLRRHREYIDEIAAGMGVDHA